MAEDKIYYPETIEVYPLPETVESEGANSPSLTAGGISYSEVLPGNPFPEATPFTRELISNSLNTITKKILGEYSFAELGAFIVGEYESGVSGEVTISPSGISAKNSAGETTFALDGDTGDATFSGAITASSVSGGTISGVTITGGTITGTTIKTASSGVRVEIVADQAKISLYDAGDDTVFVIDETGSNVQLISADGRGMVVGSAGSMLIDAGTGLYLEANSGVLELKASGNIEVVGTLDLNSNNINDVASIDGGGNSVQFDDDIDMNDNVVGDLNRIVWNTRSTNPSDSWALYMYDNSGYSLRTRMDGSTWSVDQTSI